MITFHYFKVINNRSVSRHGFLHVAVILSIWHGQDVSKFGPKFQKATNLKTAKCILPPLCNF